MAALHSGMLHSIPRRALVSDVSLEAPDEFRGATQNSLKSLLQSFARIPLVAKWMVCTEYRAGAHFMRSMAGRIAARAVWLQAIRHVVYASEPLCHIVCS